MREPFNNDCYFPRSECVFQTVLSRDMLDSEWTQNQILILFQVCQYVGSSDVSVAPFCLFISTKSTNKESCCKKLVSCLMMCCLVVFRSDISQAKTVWPATLTSSNSVLQHLKYVQIASLRGLQKFQHSVWMSLLTDFTQSVSQKKQRDWVFKQLTKPSKSRIISSLSLSSCTFNFLLNSILLFRLC